MSEKGNQPAQHSKVEVLDGPGPDPVLPLTIRAKDDTSVDFLKQWIAANREWIRKKTIEHGKTVRHCFFKVPLGIQTDETSSFFFGSRSLVVISCVCEHGIEMNLANELRLLL